MCAHGFPIKDFGNDDYCRYYLLGLVFVMLCLAQCNIDHILEKENVRLMTNVQVNIAGY